MSGLLRYIGIDEAGLGPNLGPLVVAAVVVDAPEDWRRADWWLTLAPTVGRAIASTVPIDDSKRIYSQPRGHLAALRTVANLCDALRISPSETHEELFRDLTLAGALELTTEHWYVPERPIFVPPLDHLRETLAAHGAEIVWARAEAIFPKRFNAGLVEFGNKSAVEAAAVQELLAAALALPGGDDLEVIVDRLGGRKFYREFVEDLAGDAFVQTRRETPDASAYLFRRDGRDCEIQFLTRADAFSMPVALASMLAKFLREEAMAAFNDFWTARIPGLKPTAGYPEDAARFWNEIADSFGALDLPKSAIWRER